MKNLIIFLILFSFEVQGQVKVGDLIPTFTLLNSNNKKVSTSTFKQKFIHAVFR